MKLLPTQTRVSNDDALGTAIEIAVVLTLFVGGGFALDRWLGTLPLFMILGTVLGSVGLFTKHKYRYDQKMDAYDAERRNATARRAGTSGVDAPTVDSLTAEQTGGSHG